MFLFSSIVLSKYKSFMARGCRIFYIIEIEILNLFILNRLSPQSLVNQMGTYITNGTRSGSFHSFSLSLIKLCLLRVSGSLSRAFGIYIYPPPTLPFLQVPGDIDRKRENKMRIRLNDRDEETFDRSQGECLSVTTHSERMEKEFLYWQRSISCCRLFIYLFKHA